MLVAKDETSGRIKSPKRLKKVWGKITPGIRR
jgi:hypothetical protein